MYGRPQLTQGSQLQNELKENLCLPQERKLHLLEKGVSLDDLDVGLRPSQLADFSQEIVARLVTSLEGHAIMPERKHRAGEPEQTEKCMKKCALLNMWKLDVEHPLSLTFVFRFSRWGCTPFAAMVLDGGISRLDPSEAA